MEPRTLNFEILTNVIKKLHKSTDEEKTELLDTFKYKLGDEYYEAFLAFIGLIPAYDLKLMEEAIDRDCERIEGEADENANGKQRACKHDGDCAVLIL